MSEAKLQCLCGLQVCFLRSVVQSFVGLGFICCLIEQISNPVLMEGWHLQLLKKLGNPTLRDVCYSASSFVANCILFQIFGYLCWDT